MSSKACCGYSLRGGTKAVGISDIFVEIGVIAFGVYSIIPHIQYLRKYCTGFREKKCHDRVTEIGIITLDSLSMFIHLLELLIIFVIYQGAQERSMGKCRVWVRTTEVLTSLDFIIFVWHMFLEIDVVMIALMIPDLIYKIYSCFVVESFVTEMRSYNGLPRQDGSHAQDAFD